MNFKEYEDYVNYDLSDYLPKMLSGYEIVGAATSYGLPYTGQKGDPYIDGRCLYKRLFIRKKH